MDYMSRTGVWRITRALLLVCRIRALLLVCRIRALLLVCRIRRLDRQSGFGRGKHCMSVVKGRSVRTSALVFLFYPRST